MLRRAVRCSMARVRIGKGSKIHMRAAVSQAEVATRVLQVDYRPEFIFAVTSWSVRHGRWWAEPGSGVTATGVAQAVACRYNKPRYARYFSSAGR